MSEKQKKVMWTGLVKSFDYDQSKHIARFSVEHRFILRVPYPLTSDGLKLLGHPDFYSVSKVSEGEDTCSVKLRIPPDSASVSNKVYGFTFIGKLESSDKPILLAANYLERFPLSGELEVIVPRDSSGNVAVDKDGNIAFQLKEEKESAGAGDK